MPAMHNRARARVSGFRCLAACVALIGVSLPSLAQVSFSPLLGDHMVLQRDKPIALAGTAPSNAEVRVELGGAAVRVRADANGEWVVRFPPRPADSTGIDIAAMSGTSRAEIRDVLIGDVWLCAGQSNMELPLSRDAEGSALLLEAETPSLRIYQARFVATGAGGAWKPAKAQRLTPGLFAPGQWSRSTGESLPTMSAVAYYFGAALHEELGVPIGLVDLGAGGTPTEAWISRQALAADESTAPIVLGGNWLENPELGDWCRERGAENLSRVLASGEVVCGDELGPNHAFKPAFMWEAAVLPWTMHPVRGVIWYQGESNAESPRRVEQHGALLPMLIQDWRRHWGDEAMPFYFVQLPAMGRPHWPAFREGQRLIAASMDHVEMAVTIDVGHPTDVHPRQKRPVGERLARLALARHYGIEMVGLGPSIALAERRGDEVWLSFTDIGSGLETSDGGKLRGFEVVLEDGTARAASARIEDAGVVVDAGRKVRFVRYAWAPVPECNLVNSENLPASPFRIEVAD